MKKLIWTDDHAREDCLEELNDIYQEIYDNTPKNIFEYVNGGDLFDKKRPTPKEIDCITYWMHKFRERAQLHILKGNHTEIDDKTSAIDYLRHLSIDICESFEHDGLFVGHFMCNNSLKNYGEWSKDKDLSSLVKHKHILLGHQHCVSADTQILTDRGWLYYYKLKNKDKIATYNLEENKIEYEFFIDLHTYNYQGKMYEFAQRALVTPNHRVVVHNKKHKFSSIKLAYQIKSNDSMLLNVSKWQYPILCNFKNPYWAELVGFIIGDGSYENINTTYFSVRIRQITNLNYLIKLIKKCHLYYTISKEKYPRIRISFTKKENKEFLTILKTKVKEKDLTRELLSMPQKQLFHLFRGLIKSDGHWYNNRYQIFSQKSKYTVELFEELCLKLGKTFITYERINWRTKKIQYQINIKQKTGRQKIMLSNRNNSINIKSYKGIVWCPEVKNGTWIAKRNGKVFITGNSFQQLSDNAWHLGAIRNVNFGEIDSPPKRIAIMDTSGIKFIELKSPIPMVEVFNVKDLNDINSRTKVRLTFKTFEQFKKEVNQVEKWKNKFNVLKIKLDFTTNIEESNVYLCHTCNEGWKESQLNNNCCPKCGNRVENTATDSINFKELVYKWLNVIKDQDVKEILEDAFKENSL